MIDNLHIKSALNNASKKISMFDTVSKETLFNFLSDIKYYDSHTYFILQI